MFDKTPACTKSDPEYYIPATTPRDPIEGHYGSQTQKPRQDNVTRRQKYFVVGPTFPMSQRSKEAMKNQVGFHHKYQ